MKHKIKLGLFMLIILAACQKEEFDYSKQLFTNPIPVFREYDNSSMEEVMLFMDSAFYMCYMAGGKGGAYHEGVWSVDSTYQNAGQKIQIGHCEPSEYDCCNIIYKAGLYSYPCDNLILNYNYDTLQANKDFVIFCRNLSPLFHQGHIVSMDTISNSEIISYYFEMEDGSIRLQDNGVTKIIEL